MCARVVAVCSTCLLLQSTCPNTRAQITPAAVLLARRINADAALGSGHGGGTQCSHCSGREGLVELDVSGAVSLSPCTLAQLLSTCKQLRRVGAAGCPSLAAGDATGLQSALRSLQQEQRQQPHEVHQSAGLTRLCVGWGWKNAAISSLLALSPLLISFSAGEVDACNHPQCMVVVCGHSTVLLCTSKAWFLSLCCIAAAVAAPPLPEQEWEPVWMTACWSSWRAPVPTSKPCSSPFAP